MATRYQLPVAEDRDQPIFRYPPAYEAPDTPLETPVDSKETVPVADEPTPLTLSDVVPVRVVNFAHEPDRFRDGVMFQMDIGAEQTKALPRRSQRTRVTLVNTHDTLEVYIGHEPTVKSTTGFPLRPTDPPLSMETQRSYYLHNPDATNTVTVAVIDEFLTELM